MGRNSENIFMHLCKYNIEEIILIHYDNDIWGNHLDRLCKYHMGRNSCLFMVKLHENLFISFWGFTPLSTLFQLYHGDSSLTHDPWVNNPVLG